MMKKLYIFTAAILTAVTISAQRSSVASTKTFDSNQMEERSPTDTLAPGAAFTGATLYTVGPTPNYGYVVGNNSYDDKQKVQIFYPTDVSFVPVPYTITGALYWF